MRAAIIVAVICSAAFSCLGLVTAVAAQASGSPLFDPAQLPTVRGVVAHYTLIPNGAADGFILEDATQVLAVPSFSGELVSTVHPGDAVTVYGLKAKGRPLVMAMVVINDKSHQSVLLGDIPIMLAMGRAPQHEHPSAENTGQHPNAESSGRDASRLSQMHGIVQLPIYGPTGHVSGALMRDGVVLRVASTEGDRLASMLTAGNQVWITGELTEGTLGKLVLVRSIGVSKDKMLELAAWDGPR